MCCREVSEKGVDAAASSKMSEEDSVSSSNASGEETLRRRKSSIVKAADSHSSASSEAKESQALNLKYATRPSAPAHRKSRESPLSSDAIFHQSHAGLFNLCIVILVAVNSRLIIENLMKYGLLIRTGFWFSSKSLKEWPLFMCGLSLPILAVCSYMVEKAKILFRTPEWDYSSVVVRHSGESPSELRRRSI
ncbi:hypothetical protein L7F22_048702 [Adiantum nelumboides]|nr:hypothetical protein [Adiantum nelumboides]